MNFTKGVIFSAISNYLGPVHIAYGNISPPNTMNITDINTANAGGTTLSKNIGNASMAKALVHNNVHNNL